MFDGLSTDSYSVPVGGAGDITGMVSFLGYPVIFKPDGIFKVYGSRPTNYQVTPSARLGVAEGSGTSVAVAGEVLFYLSKSGIVSYSGGIPSSISEPFGEARYKNAVAGSDGLKYYVSMQDDKDDWHLFVYDTQSRLWHKEDDLQAIGFAYAEDNLYCLADDGKIWAMGNAAISEGIAEDSVEWFAEFGGFTEQEPNKKGVTKLRIRAELAKNSTMTVKIKFDNEEWTPIRTVSAMKKSSFSIPVIPGGRTITGSGWRAPGTA